MTTPPLYRLHWRSRLTGATGYSTRAFTRDLVQADCDLLTQTCPMMEHWLEPVPESAPDEKTEVP